MVQYTCVQDNQSNKTDTLSEI